MWDFPSGCEYSYNDHALCLRTILMNKLIQSLVVFFITIVLVVIGAEFYYRSVNQEVLGNTASLSYQKWAKSHVQLNSWGFRDQERSLKKPNSDVYRVLLIGPSNIYGQAISNLEERLSEQLQNRLNQASAKPIEVINMGTMTMDTIGTSAMILMKMAEAGLEYDSVIVYYTWNTIRHIPEIAEAYNQAKASHYQASNPIDTSLKQHSYFYDWVSNVSKDKGFLIDGKTYNQWHLSFYQNQQYFPQHIAVLRYLNAITLAQKTKLYFLITPISYNEKERNEYASLTKNLMTELDKYNISYIDSTHIYDGIPEAEIPVSKYDGHNKSKFYSVMADLTAPQILKDINATN